MDDDDFAFNDFDQPYTNMVWPGKRHDLRDLKHLTGADVFKRAEEVASALLEKHIEETTQLKDFLYGNEDALFFGWSYLQPGNWTD